jgi:hypothetical protein
MTDQSPTQEPDPRSGQPQYPYPPYPPPPYAYAPPVNMYAILSLVFAVAVFPPVGIYFGYKAKEQIARTGERGVELATAGLVIGWIFSAMYGLFCLIWCGFAGFGLLANGAHG